MEEDSGDIFSGMFGGILYGLGISDLAIPIGFLLWMTIFTVSLKKFDCSNQISAVVYSIFCTAMGVILVLAIPKNYIKATGFHIDFIFVAIFFAISYSFWEKERKIQKRQLKEKLEALTRRLKDG